MDSGSREHDVTRCLLKQVECWKFEGMSDKWNVGSSKVCQTHGMLEVWRYVRHMECWKFEGMSDLWNVGSRAGRVEYQKSICISDTRNAHRTHFLRCFQQQMDEKEASVWGGQDSMKSRWQFQVTQAPFSSSSSTFPSSPSLFFDLSPKTPSCRTKYFSKCKLL